MEKLTGFATGKYVESWASGREWFPVTSVFAWETGRKELLTTEKEKPLAWAGLGDGRWNSKSWALAVLSLICLRDIHMEMSARKLHVRDGIQTRGLDNTTSGAKACYLKLQNQVRLPRKWVSKERRRCPMTQPTLQVEKTEMDAAEEEARRKRWACRVLEAKRRNQGSVLNTTAKKHYWETNGSSTRFSQQSAQVAISHKTVASGTTQTSIKV